MTGETRLFLARFDSEQLLAFILFLQFNPFPLLVDSAGLAVSSLDFHLLPQLSLAFSIRRADLGAAEGRAGKGVSKRGR